MARTFNNLWLFDYDGVVAFNPKSFGIMQEALEMTLKSFHLDTNLPFTRIFGDTSGTTETKLAETVCRKAGFGNHSLFLDRFTTQRTKLIREYDEVRKKQPTDIKSEYIYSDFLELIGRLGQTDMAQDTVVALVTGNPSKVMDERLPHSLRDTFRFRVTGEMANNRGDLIKIALEKADKKGWRPNKNICGDFQNAFYVDDTERATLEALSLGIKCVHPVRRDMAMGVPDQQSIFEKVMGKFDRSRAMQILSGNGLSSPNLFVAYRDMGMSSPGIFDGDNSPGARHAQGFMDPAAHIGWSEWGEGNLRTEFGFDPHLRAGRR